MKILKKLVPPGLNETSFIARSGSFLVSLAIAYPAYLIMTAKTGFDMHPGFAILYVFIVEYLFLASSAVMAKARIHVVWVWVINFIVAAGSLFFPVYEKTQIIMNNQTDIIVYQQELVVPVKKQASINELESKLESLGATERIRLQGEIEYYQSPANFDRVIWTDPETKKEFKGEYYVSKYMKKLAVHESSLAVSKNTFSGKINKLEKEYEKALSEYNRVKANQNNNLNKSTDARSKAVFNAYCFVAMYIFLILLSTVFKICAYRIERPEKKIESTLANIEDERKPKDIVKDDFYPDAYQKRNNGKSLIVCSAGIIGEATNAPYAWKAAAEYCLSRSPPSKNLPSITKKNLMNRRYLESTKKSS